MAASEIDSIKKIFYYLQNASKPQVYLSALFFRDYSCPAGCGGCCKKYTLDYFEGERWELFKVKFPELVPRFEKREVNGVIIHTDFQKDNNTHHCVNLDLSNGRCKIHKFSPFTCEFELMKLTGSEDKTKKPQFNKPKVSITEEMIFIMAKMMNRGDKNKDVANYFGFDASAVSDFKVGYGRYINYQHLLLKNNLKAEIAKENEFKGKYNFEAIQKNDMEYIPSTVAFLINKLFSRGWNMLRVDGERGAKCSMLPFNYNKLLNDIKLLKELKYISELFNIKTKLPTIISYLELNLSTYEKNDIPKHNVLF